MDEQSGSEDGERTCPLCEEILDPTDRVFFPCPCEYQVRSSANSGTVPSGHSFLTPRCRLFLGKRGVVPPCRNLRTPFLPRQIWLQICVLCFHTITTESSNGKCPACRQCYDLSLVKQEPTQLPLLAKAPARKKDPPARATKAEAPGATSAADSSAPSSDRSHLADVRVLQRHLVLVSSLPHNVSEQARLPQPPFTSGCSLQAGRR